MANPKEPKQLVLDLITLRDERIDAYVKACAEEAARNKEAYIAHVLLQNPTIHLLDYSLCIQSGVMDFGPGARAYGLYPFTTQYNRYWLEKLEK